MRSNIDFRAENWPSVYMVAEYRIHNDNAVDVVGKLITADSEEEAFEKLADESKQVASSTEVEKVLKTCHRIDDAAISRVTNELLEKRARL